MQYAAALLSSLAYPTLQYFSTLSHKQHDFRKKKKYIIDNKTCALILPTAFA